MKTFKGTKGKWFPVEYAGLILIQTRNKYNEPNILDMDYFSTKEVKANAKLIASSPELLKALELILSNSNDHAMIRIAYKAINKAL